MKKMFIIAALTVLYLFKTPYINIYSAIENTDEEASTAAQADASAELPVPPEIRSGAAALMDAKTGIVLFQQAQDEENYPASITKIMTALITLEQCEDLDERITFSRQAVYTIPRDASHIAMDEGESLTVRDALHGLLLASANEVANALAEHIAGSIEDFAVLMNKRAAVLGAENTHFTNPSGLFDAEHVTTARDMALIMREAVKHDEFVEIISKRRYDLPPTERQAESRRLLNTNDLIHPGKFFNEDVIGGKTGYTDESMHTLVNYAERDGRSLIAAVMRGDNEAKYTDTIALLEYGFNLPYEETVVFDSGEYLRTVPVYAETDAGRFKVGDAAVKSENDLTYNLPEGFDTAEIRYDLELPAELTAPVAAGFAAGKVTCYIQDIKIGEASLKSLNAVYTPPLPTDGRDGNATINVMASDVEPITAAETETALNSLTRLAPTDGQQTGTRGNIGGQNADESGVFPFTGDDYLKVLAIPAALSLFVMLISLIAFLRKRRRRQRNVLSFGRFVKYENGKNIYRYK